MDNPINYTALAAECEAKAKAGVGPEMEWESHQNGEQFWTIQPWGMIRFMRYGYIKDGEYDGKTGYYFEPFFRMPIAGPMSTITPAMLFAEALLRDETKPLHREAYEAQQHVDDLCTALCHATDQRMSKPGYTVDAMIGQIDDVRQRAIDRATDALRTENQRLRTALEGIVGYSWTYIDIADDKKAEMQSCPDCAECQKRNWPPSRMCDKHYRIVAENQDRNQRAMNSQHIDMRQIARKALSPEASNAASVTIESLIQPIHQWQLQTFPRATALSKALHLLEEAKELVAKPTDGEEMADILMLLIGIASITGTNLTEELRKKFEKNKARKWGTPDADGVVRHVEEASNA